MTVGTQNIRYEDDGMVVVLFDLRIYRILAIKKAAYKYAADCGAVIKQLNDTELEVQLTFSKDLASESKDSIVRSFCNEVLDQDLRECIAIETEGTRNLILAQAFSKTDLLAED